MDIEVVTYNEDGTVSFQGRINAEQARFILGVGVNFLMQQGAYALTDDEGDEIDDYIDEQDAHEGPDTIQ